MCRLKSSVAQALPSLIRQLFLPAIVAFFAALFALWLDSREQEKQERVYVEQLREAVVHEARLNATSIRRWIPSLVGIAKDLEAFIKDKGSAPPSVNPGHAGLTAAALQLLVESPIAARHVLPCLHTVFATVRYRLDEGNAVKTHVDTALADYTATFPGLLSESHEAAARLHARIEQLLMIYKDLPASLEQLIEADDARLCGDDEV